MADDRDAHPGVSRGTGARTDHDTVRMSWCDVGSWYLVVPSISKRGTTRNSGGSSRHTSLGGQSGSLRIPATASCPGTSRLGSPSMTSADPNGRHAAALVAQRVPDDAGGPLHAAPRLVRSTSAAGVLQQNRCCVTPAPRTHRATGSRRPPRVVTRTSTGQPRARARCRAIAVAHPDERMCHPTTIIYPAPP